MNHKKALKEAYLNRKTEMGILCFCCQATNDRYLAATKDARATINSNIAQLNFNSHSNKEMQSLWNEHGEHCFTIDFIDRMVYDEREHCEEYVDDLKELLEIHLLEDKNVKPVWKWARI